MRRSGWLLGIFAVVALAQIYVPASMILTYESTLREGRAFKVRVEPVDPSDAFRGRYVWLRLDLRTVPMPPPAPEMIRRKVFATLEEGPDGFARAREISTVRPAHPDYVEAEAIGVHTEYPAPADPNGRVKPFSTGEIDLRLTVDRYYMEERKAPEAERAVRESARQEKTAAWVVVRVRGGVAVIERLYAGGVPIEEYIDRAAKPAG